MFSTVTLVDIVAIERWLVNGWLKWAEFVEIAGGLKKKKEKKIAAVCWTCWINGLLGGRTLENNIWCLKDWREGVLWSLVCRFWLAKSHYLVLVFVVLCKKWCGASELVRLMFAEAKVFSCRLRLSFGAFATYRLFVLLKTVLHNAEQWGKYVFGVAEGIWIIITLPMWQRGEEARERSKREAVWDIRKRGQ